MTTTHFRDVYDLEELASQIMDHLALSALLALSYTSKGMHLQVHRYIRFKLTLIFQSFGISANDLVELFRITHSLIIGTIALKAVAPAILPIQSNQIDIVTPTIHISLLKVLLVDRYGYAMTDSASSLHYHLLPPVRYHFTLTKMVNDQRRTINLYAVNKRHNTYEMIFYASNTAHMNAIIGWGIFTAYPSLLDRGRAVHNHISNNLVMRYLSSPIRRARIIRAGVVCEIETMASGFQFNPVYPFPHTLGRCPGICMERSSCPLLKRELNDAHCSFMPLYTDSQFEQSPLAIILCRPFLPPIIWQIADAEGGRPGYTMVLSDQVIRQVVLEGVQNGLEETLPSLSD